MGIWIGFIINTIDFTLSVSTEKIRKLLRMIPRDLGGNTAPISAREIAKIAGTLISMSPAIGSLTRLFTRKIYSFIDTSCTWDRNHTLDHGTISELKFWQQNLTHVNGYAIKNTYAITKIIYSDASCHSYGGYMVQNLGNVIAHGAFSRRKDDEFHSSWACRSKIYTSKFRIFTVSPNRALALR